MTSMAQGFEPRPPVSRLKPRRGLQPLEGRPSMLIYCASSTHLGANIWSSARNCRTILSVYRSILANAAIPTDLKKLFAKQRLGAKQRGHGYVTQRDPGVSSFRPPLSCNLATALDLRGRSKMDGIAGSRSGDAIRPPVTGAQHWRAL